MYTIVLDTETTNSIEEPLTYDIGWAVVNTDTYEIVKTESYAVAEIFLDSELMSYAFFADKIPSYWEEIKHGARKLARLSTIRWSLVADIKAYGITEIYAHNMRFDDGALRISQRYLTGSKYRYFFPYGIKVCDTLKMSRKAFNDDDYKSFCKQNGYVLKNGACRYTAEILFRYISNDNDFVEEHRGIDDVLIESQILFECLKRGVTDGALWD